MQTGKTYQLTVNILLPVVNTPTEIVDKKLLVLSKSNQIATRQLVDVGNIMKRR